MTVPPAGAEPYHCTIPVRWADLDAQGHANNATVVDYLQEARVDYLLKGPNAHLLGNGIVVVGHQVEYTGAIEFTPEPLDVQLLVSEVGASRFTIGYLVFQGGRRVVRARTHLCIFDFATQRPARLAAEERAVLVADSADLEALRPVGAWRVGALAHHHAVVVRWSDLDSYGHVNNAMFYEYLGEARVAMMAGLLPNAIRSGMDASGQSAWLVARQDITYVAQMVHRLEAYRVRTAIGGVGRTSVTLAAEIVDPLDGTVHARATTVLVHSDPLGTPVPVPDAVRAAAGRWPAEESRRPAG